jgi:hypothetical protein
MTSEAEIEQLRAQVAALSAELKEKELAQDTVAPYSRSFNRTMINTIISAPDGGKSQVNLPYHHEWVPERVVRLVERAISPCTDA